MISLQVIPDITTCIPVSDFHTRMKAPYSGPGVYLGKKVTHLVIRKHRRKNKGYWVIKPPDKSNTMVYIYTYCNRVDRTILGVSYFPTRMDKR